MLPSGNTPITYFALLLGCLQSPVRLFPALLDATYPCRLVTPVAMIPTSGYCIYQPHFLFAHLNSTFLA
jgi:hypothetical protein